MPASAGRILIADDDPVSLLILQELFTGAGYTVCAVKSGEEALNSAPSFDPDIVLLDTVMQGLHGFEVCERLKANRSTAHIPVVFISSSIDAETEIAGLKAGGIDFISKPFNPAIVRMRITNYAELKKGRDNLETLSITDALTGLSNRRYFDRMMVSEYRRCSRSHDCISLAMIDVDRFKIYNDNNGHLAGDECLKLVAKRLKAEFKRMGDLVARYGGEEFAVLLPSTPEEAAVKLGDTARKGVEELGILYTGKHEDGSVTVSVGVACVLPGPGDQPKALLDNADKALYLAKAKGRNRVWAAQ